MRRIFDDLFGMTCVPASLVGFDGTRVRDRYAACNGIGFDWQACLAHIITNAKNISRERALLPTREQDRAVSLFCD